ncbi:MAG: hypothetical protein ACFB5Z_03520 [Elainellaceae cyanobacterium]
MVKPNNILMQAEQGSVAAIIQVLNQQLSTSGVRVRAVLVKGVLQLLCEAGDAARLERQQLVQHIRQILESLHPRHIRRVRINSRIVNEQQLLWLDEVNRDADSQLLWSEDIVLSWRNPVTQIVKRWRDQAKESDILPLSAIRQQRERRQFWRGLWGGALLGVGTLVAGGLLYSWLQSETPGGISISRLTGIQLGTQPQTTDNQPSASERSDSDSLVLNSIAGAKGDRSGAPSAQSAPQSALSPTPPQPADPFAEAVRIAERAAVAGQTASTQAEWLELAAAWQQASNFMGQVASGDGRYATAQDRYQLYQQYEAAARSQAQRAQ